MATDMGQSGKGFYRRRISIVILFRSLDSYLREWAQ